jgi:cytochrome c oxidase subunit 2
VPQEQFDRWAELMLAGDYDAAAASVQTIASVEPATKFAAVTE